LKKSLRGYEARTAKLKYWYAYLRLSKSYSVATRYKQGKLTWDAAIREVPDLKAVLPIYEEFGDVWKKNPLDWLTENSYELGKHLKTEHDPKILSILTGDKIEKNRKTVEKFSSYLENEWEASGRQPHIVVSIPLQIKKNNLFDFMRQLLDEHQTSSNDAVSTAKTQPSMKLTAEKVRMDALERGYNLVLIEAQNPNYAEWQVAECLGLSPKSVEAVKKREAEKTQGINTPDYGEDPNYDMSIHTVLRRYRRYAWVLAENAARGKFPLNDEAERTAQGEKIVVQFDTESLRRHTHYLSRQLQERGMDNKYANEFLKADAGINRKRFKDDE
jgi:hypothetical protein